jgi:hypothetical protein
MRTETSIPSPNPPKSIRYSTANSWAAQGMTRMVPKYIITFEKEKLLVFVK